LDSLAHDAASPLNPFGLASLFGLVAAIGCYLQNKMRYKNFTDGISSFAVPFFTITAYRSRRRLVRSLRNEIKAQLLLSQRRASSLNREYVSPPIFRVFAERNSENYDACYCEDPAEERWFVDEPALIPSAMVQNTLRDGLELSY
jgi:hypothetical protein